MGRQRWGIPVGLSERFIDETGDWREASYNFHGVRYPGGRKRIKELVSRPANRHPDSKGLHFDEISDNHLEKRGPCCEREEEGEWVCKGRSPNR